MKIWVDADACPNPIKAILFRAAERRQTQTVLVANHHVRVPPSAYLSSVQVPGGFDVADHAIVDQLAPGDLVITADVPLAAEVVRLGATALNPRGTLYGSENIEDLLARRNRSEQLREAGAATRSHSALDKSDLQAFANQLDRFLTAQQSRSAGPPRGGRDPCKIRSVVPEPGWPMNQNDRDIRQTLVELHQELENTPELDDDLRALLMDVDHDIHALLAAQDHPESGANGLRDRLEAVAADFAAQHPNTERFFREVIHALGRMGI